MTKRDWQAKAVTMILSANPDAAVHRLTFDWRTYRANVRYPTGYRGRMGTVTVMATGFRSTSFDVTSNLDGFDMMVRPTAAGARA
jgi:hypothetical protein